MPLNPVNVMMGYRGSRYTPAEVFSSTSWNYLDPEVQDRAWNLIVTSIEEGHEVGIGGTGRPEGAQDRLFRSRYHVVKHVTPLVYDGEYWEKNPGVAAAAVPGFSYHELMLPVEKPKCFAIDAIGDMVWLHNNCKRFGFRNFNSEKWHIQPIEFPAARRHFKDSMWPLPDKFPTATLYPETDERPVVEVPEPDLRKNDSGEEVLLLQNAIVFWGLAHIPLHGFLDEATERGLKSFQTFLKVTPDGWYGKKTAAAYRKFLESIVDTKGVIIR